MQSPHKINKKTLSNFKDYLGYFNSLETHRLFHLQETWVEVINSTSLTSEVLKSTLEVSEGEGPFLYCFASEEGKLHALEAYKLSIFLLGFLWKGKSKRATLGSALGPDSPCGGVKLLCIAHSFPYNFIKDIHLDITLRENFHVNWVIRTVSLTRIFRNMIFCRNQNVHYAGKRCM